MEWFWNYCCYVQSTCSSKLWLWGTLVIFFTSVCISVCVCVCVSCCNTSLSDFAVCHCLKHPLGSVPLSGSPSSHTCVRPPVPMYIRLLARALWFQLQGSNFVLCMSFANHGRNLVPGLLCGQDGLGSAKSLCVEHPSPKKNLCPETIWAAIFLFLPYFPFANRRLFFLFL